MDTNSTDTPILSSTAASFDERSELMKQTVYSEIENEITDRLKKIVDSRFWIGTHHDSETYKAGMKSVGQIQKLLKGLVTLKAAMPLEAQDLFS